MESAFRSSQFALAFAMGVGVYIGVLHLWMWRRREGGAPHFWVVFFSLGSLGFQIARYLQLDAASPQLALSSGRFQVAMAPVLVFSLVGFARSLGRGRGSPRLFALFGAANAALAVAAWRTALFIPKVDGVGLDWFGHPYLAAPGSPSLALLLPYILASAVYISREIILSPELERKERQLLVASLATYGMLGFLSVLSALEAVSFPVMTHYGPLVVAVGLSYMLLHRHQRQHLQLEQAAEDQAQALGASEARYRLLVDSAPVGIAACRADGQLVAVNRRMLEILGAPADARLSESGRITVLPDGSDAPSILGTPITRALLECIKAGESAAHEIACRSHWGLDMELRLNVASVRDESGAITGAQAIVEDVSVRRRFEDHLRQSQKMEAVGHLVAGIAHEINNPMAYVRTNLKLLQDEWSLLMASGTLDMGAGAPSELKARSEDFKELIEESLEGVDRTIAIVRDVKEFSHSGEAGAERVDLNEVVESSVRMATARLGSGIRVERAYSELSPAHCSGGQLRQVILNVLMNAIHAMDGSGTIQVSSREEADALVIGVKDDGCGIPDDVLEHLFDPFFTTKSEGQGTGLGLYISYQIMRAHGGDIQVESVVGEGALFEIRLPKGEREPGSLAPPSALRR